MFCLGVPKINANELSESWKLAKQRGGEIAEQLLNEGGQQYQPCFFFAVLFGGLLQQGELIVW